MFDAEIKRLMLYAEPTALLFHQHHAIAAAATVCGGGVFLGRSRLSLRSSPWMLSFRVLSSRLSLLPKAKPASSLCPTLLLRIGNPLAIFQT